jgi:hypothetical protein
MSTLIANDMSALTDNPLVLVGALAGVFFIVKAAAGIVFKLVIFGAAAGLLFFAGAADGTTIEADTGEETEVVETRTGPLSSINGLSNEELKEAATPPKYIQDAASGAVDYLKSDEAGEMLDGAVEGAKELISGFFGD